MSKLTDRAKELELEGNLEVALTYYEMALGDKSSSFDVRNDFGRVLNKLANYEEARDCFNLVLAIDDKNFDAWFGKGVSNLGLNDWKGALDSFNNALKVDDTNANCYYYIAIILKEFRNDKAKDYYNKFLSLDNDNFKKIRSFYEFGLLFKHNDLELQDSDKKININGYVNVLRSYDLDDGEIVCLLRTLPLDKLKEKIILFNDLKYEKDEKRIIFEKLFEFGLDEESINELFRINSNDIEMLKKEVISQCGMNPFENKPNPPEIQLYVVEKSKPVFEESSIDIKDMPVLFASKYNKFEELSVEKGILLSVKEGVLSSVKEGWTSIKKKVGPKKERILRKTDSSFKIMFKRIKILIDDGNYKSALNLIESYNLSKVPEKSLRINLMFYNASLFAINNKPKEALFLFERMEKEDSNIKYDPIYLFNKRNALYDYGNYGGVIDCHITWNWDVVEIFVMASAYYKIGDFKSALEFYDKLSDEYKDETILENIKNKISNL